MKALIALMLMAAVPAFAHAKLTGSTPAANASVTSPPQIKLQFSEPLAPAFRGAALAGPAGQPNPVSVSVGATGITQLPGLLLSGQYSETWLCEGHVSHRVTVFERFKVTP